MPLIICSAQSTDLPSITRLESACFPDPWSEKTISETLVGTNASIWVGRIYGQDAIAYVIASCVLDEASIERIGVDPANRGQGFGRLMLRHTLTEFAARGIATVWLEVRSSNLAARTLYESEGFHTLGVRKKYYGGADPDDAEVMMWTTR
jgi:ribosomal-protein-alanine N-acetyltransferase